MEATGRDALSAFPYSVNPWNPQRAAFRVIVFVLVCEVVMVVISYCLCVWVGLQGMRVSAACEDGRLSRLMADALAVGLALYSSKGDEK